MGHVDTSPTRSKARTMMQPQARGRCMDQVVTCSTQAWHIVGGTNLVLPSVISHEDTVLQ